MASVKAIRRGLAAALPSGLRAAPAFDKVTPPAALFQLDDTDFDVTFQRGVDGFEWTIRVLVSKADDKAGQDRLDDFCDGSGATSVKAALEADQTLGGVAQTVRVTGVKNYGVYDIAGTAYLGAEFAVTVHAAGST